MHTEDGHRVFPRPRGEGARSVRTVPPPAGVSSFNSGLEGGANTVRRSGSPEAAEFRSQSPSSSYSSFATTPTGLRMRRNFAAAAHTLTALYKEASEAYHDGLRDARDEIYQYVLDALRHAQHLEAATGRSGESVAGQDSQRFGAEALSAAFGVRIASSLHSAGAGGGSGGGASTRRARTIDADALLTFLSMSNLAHSMTSLGTRTAGDCPHTFGRRRPRTSAADADPTCASDGDLEEETEERESRGDQWT